MANVDMLSCPFCLYDTRDISALTEHVDVKHSDQKESDSKEKLSDFELAQVLAFEEAGLPAELALSKHNGLGDEDGQSTNSERAVAPVVRNRDDAWVQCVCGERVLLCELDIHADMHAQESISIEDISSGSRPDSHKQSKQDARSSTSSSSSSRGKRRSLTMKDYFFSPSSPKKHVSHKPTYNVISSPRRLGRSELGPYAHERRMPDQLYRLLVENDRRIVVVERTTADTEAIKFRNWHNQTRNIVPILAHLSESDETVIKARYCSFEVDHIYKVPNEGGFCGYRNIQMLLSYIRNARIPGYEHFPLRVPTILELQDKIEEAWTNGYNASGRVETGGIRMTRKYIGTPEAEALLSNLKIGCQMWAFSSSGAEKNMLKAVEEYFEKADEVTKDDKVVVTNLGPIYYQHRGHSMTVVGMEWKAKSVNLVVFDPMFATSAAIKSLARRIGHGPISNPSVYMKACRRGHEYFSRYDEFELLTLTDKTPPQKYSGERDGFGLEMPKLEKQTSNT